MQKRKQNIFVTIALLSVIHAQAQAPEWVRIFEPSNAVHNIKPYYYFEQAATPILSTMQKNVSSGVVILKITNTGTGTGTFIRTDPALPYICLLTAGHNVVPLNGSTPLIKLLYSVGFRYRRTAQEDWGDDFTTNVEFHNTSRVIAGVLGAEFTKDQDKTITDYGLLAYPKKSFESGLSVYEAPYDFPTDITIPSTSNDELFMIHHALAQPQRLSELSNGYSDEARNYHFIQSNSSPFDQLWDINYWSNGSLFIGTSGAALIRPLAEEPTIIGILAAGNPLAADIDSQAPTPFSPTLYSRAMVAKAATDTGYWDSEIYKLSNIADLIRTKCGCSDKDALKGSWVTPLKVKLPTTQIITSQSALIGYSTAMEGLQNYTHVGDVIFTSSLSNIQANIHVEQGSIKLNPGFSALTAKGVELAIGLITSNVPGTASATRPANPPFEEDPEPIEKMTDDAAQIKQSFKVYPSPTRGIINVSPGIYEEAYTVRITDITGKEVYRDNSPATGRRQTDLSSKMIAGGTYFLQVLPADAPNSPVTWKLEVIK